MKHFLSIVFLFVAALAGSINAGAYEVYEHNQGDENHLVPESKVMKANVACIGNLYFYRNSAGDFAIDYRNNYKNEYKCLCFFDPKNEYTYTFTQPGEFTIADAVLRDGNRQEINVYYDPSGTNKSYRIILTSFDGKTMEVKGIPTFYKGDDRGFPKDVIGSEKSVGTHPVFLDWLEHWTKKMKFKSINAE